MRKPRLSELIMEPSAWQASRSTTRHARARMQQRGICGAHVDLLVQFGREHHDHHGAVVVLLDRRARRRIAGTGSLEASELDELRRLYVVVGNDGSLRTVGHRTRRLRRH
jgi:hypothetical protein